MCLGLMVFRGFNIGKHCKKKPWMTLWAPIRANNQNGKLGGQPQLAIGEFTPEEIRY